MAPVIAESEGCPQNSVVG
jgi:hypothetical protein